MWPNSRDKIINVTEAETVQGVRMNRRGFQAAFITVLKDIFPLFFFSSGVWVEVIFVNEVCVG